MTTPPSTSATTRSAAPVGDDMAAPATRDRREPAGEIVPLGDQACYRISSYHRLPPFLMSIASDTDLWMFITSGGGLTAGRRNPDGALFPYETEDKLHNGHHHTGPITLLRVGEVGGHGAPWEPFSAQTAEDPRVERNLYKSILGNQVTFEEIHHGLRMTFRYRWSGCDEWGLVRTATLVNHGDRMLSVEVLDGLRNLLPHGAPLALYQHSSVLIDAYKRADLDPSTGLAIYSLTSKITDRAEAAEELRANIVGCHGLGSPKICLSVDAVAAFRRGDPVHGEPVLTGRPGNFLIVAPLKLGAGEQASWHLAANVGRSHVQIASLRARVLAAGDTSQQIENDLRNASESLLRNVASADGIQLTGHPEATAHHLANVLFNNMRGGIFARNYDVSIADVEKFMHERNRPVAERHGAFLEALPAVIRAPELLQAAEREADPDLIRLCHEYLPLYFGRRHGDPSRPWNRFSIRVRNADGSVALDYEGNWRDIFQNWEALGASFPEFLPNLIARFVNASTVDGFNPYRITRGGLDWEVPEPGNPWSNIGYWGDHQIIYLLKLLEALDRHAPGALASQLRREIFCYADVPYRLKRYAEMVADPRATIEYDTSLAARIAVRVAAIGSDGKLVPALDGSVYYVCLLEKLLVPALSKISNFVSDGGIWMNTQRPEWNDANNALAGNGVSVVTLFHLRRYLNFLAELLADQSESHAPISIEVVDWFRRLNSILSEHRPSLRAGGGDGRARKELMDLLGTAFEDYRGKAYSRGFSGKQELPVKEIVAFSRLALEHVDRSIHGNRREDGLFHSYNLLEISNEGKRAELRRLDVMLEGQVAALDSGLIAAPEAAGMISSLFASRLYRPDQKSFMLYPEKKLPGFIEKNVVPEDKALAVPLLRDLLEAKEHSILERDALGVYRFQGGMRSAPDLDAALDRLGQQERWAGAVQKDRQAVLDLFESVFRHHAFTGRSGTMYAYEGLGSIYWHMVAKLLLALQEITLKNIRGDQPDALRESLVAACARIRGGFGYEKTVTEYGAVPTDPYSHTPARAGARQPGMTGQVKEAILTRFGELGLRVEAGRVRFRPELLSRREFLDEPGTFRYYDLEGRARSLTLAAGSLAFTYCQVPVIFEQSRAELWIRVTARDGTSTTIPGDRLDAPNSRSLFAREGAIARIDVGVPEPTQ